MPVINCRCTASRFVRQIYIKEHVNQNFRLTDLCLTYLTFDCLKLDLGESQVHQSILNEDYSFLEYAANNWLNHLKDLGTDKGPFGPVRHSDIRRKTKAVLDLHQDSRAQDCTPTADIARYFLGFSDCPEIYLHPILRDEAHLNQRSGGGSSLNPSVIQLRPDTCFSGGSTGTDPQPHPFLLSHQLLRTRKALEQIVASHTTEDIFFLRECYGPISFKCSVVGCLRYDVGFEKPQERYNHLRSHDRPVKCPERGCFYREVGFENYQDLNRHFSSCHKDPTSSKFLFPRPTASRLPAEDEQERFREAIESEDICLVRDLVHRYSSLQDRAGLDGYTGLQHAARHGKVGSALLLLHSGSNIGAVNKHGTALNVACSYGQTNMVQFLLSNTKCEEDVNSKDDMGDTPLLSILRSRHISARPAVVRLLLEDSRVSTNIKDCDGRAPLSLAAASESLEVLKLLLDHDGIDVDTKDNNGRTPLSWAVGMGTTEVVKFLLEHGVGVDVNAKDSGSMTPLTWATRMGTTEIVKSLLEHGVGVDVNAKDSRGMTPLSWAARMGTTEIVMTLLEYGVGIDVNAKDNNGVTPLLWAAKMGSAEVVKPLLDHRAVVDVNAKDGEGMTPLSWAARLGFIEVVESLMEHGVGVDVNAKDNGGRTPLSFALARSGLGNESLVKVLVKHGGIGGTLAVMR